MLTSFKRLRLGVVFQANKYDLTQWVKTSSRTARLLENNQVFYWRELEPVLPLHFINTNDTLRA